jgi:hypothetical protein
MPKIGIFSHSAYIDYGQKSLIIGQAPIMLKGRKIASPKVMLLALVSTEICMPVFRARLRRLLRTLTLGTAGGLARHGMSGEGRTTCGREFPAALSLSSRPILTDNEANHG